MRTSHFASAVALLVAAGAAHAAINGVVMVNREFNDYPDSTLVATNSYPALVDWNESSFHPEDGGPFANRHSAYFSSDGGATKHAFTYTDGFDAKTTLTLTSANVNGREAGFHADLFGLGFFGLLANGHVAAFGSILPFWDPGVVYTPSTTTVVSLEMIYTPGAGNGTSDNGGIPSTMTYIFDFGAGPVSSGPLAFGGVEGGPPVGQNWYVGLGTQNVGSNDTPTDAAFTNTSVTSVAPVPAPGFAGLAGALGLAGLRRRR